MNPRSLLSLLVCAGLSCTLRIPDKPFCGDGLLHTGEECDDGNTEGGDGCDATCGEEPVCGDGTLQLPEACDDGNIEPGDGCASDCTLEPFCGDGIVQGQEGCDDGNTISGDGCDQACVIEIPPGCGDAVVQAGEQCDDGNQVNGDGCDNNCTDTACGNSIIAGNEECDDGNNTAGDGCNAGCFIEGFDIFLDKMETGINGWASQILSGEATDFFQSSDRSFSPTTSWYSGPTPLREGDASLTSPDIDLSVAPVGARVLLSFQHFFHFDNCGDSNFNPDGGIIEISVDGGPFTLIEPADGYPGVIDSDSCANPLAGAPAFTQDSGDTFIETVVDLSAFVGSVVQISFHVGWDCDNCVVEEGWYIDDVRVFIP